MAQKEATVYIVDVGESMGQPSSGRKELNLDWAMQYVWNRITSTVATGRKTALLGVLGLRTDLTNNPMQEEEAFSNISVIQPIRQTLMPDLRELHTKIQPSNTAKGDAISAVVIAIQMISEQCKKLQYDRKIVLVTDGTGVHDDDNIDEISKKIKQDRIDFLVLGVDFDDPEYGFKEEDKDESKARNEHVLRTLVESCDGTFGTLAQAIDELNTPRIKTVRPVPSYKGLLSLGDPENFDTAMTIDVERYPRTMVQKPPTASAFVFRHDMAAGESTAQSSATIEGDTGPERFSHVRNARTYQVVDDTAPGGKRDVEREELAKGYEYGRTAVHMTESEENVTKLETKTGLEIMGFVPADQFESFMEMSRSNVIIAQRTNHKASMALSSLIHGLYELDSYAVARLVQKDNKEPLILLLAPTIEPDFECLTDVELPFSEDIRNYRFPPLNHILTVSGKKVQQHRNLPSDALKEAMSKFVDEMDLSEIGKNDEGEVIEYAAMEETFSPILHRINQAIRYKAVHPEGEVPPVAEVLTRFSKPPENLSKLAQPALDAVVTAAEVKRVPPRRLARKRNRETEKPLSGLDVDALLKETKRVRISPDNAIPEFKQYLASTNDLDSIAIATEQMGKIITDYVHSSVGDSGYGRAVEALRVMRDELTELEEPEKYNDFITSIKKAVLGGDLGGDRTEFWWMIRANRLGLIDQRSHSFLKVTEEEARSFLTGK